MCTPILTHLEMGPSQPDTHGPVHPFCICKAPCPRAPSDCRPPHTHTPVPPVKSKASLAFVVPESSQPDSCSWHWGGRIHITLKLMVCLWQSLQKRTRSQARGSSHLSQVGVMPLSPGYAFQPLLAVEPRAALLGPFTPSSPRTWPAGVTAQEGVGPAGGR